MYRSLLIIVLCALLIISSSSYVFSQKVPSPSQYSTIKDYEKATGKRISSFNEAPTLTELVKQGKLPPVEKRLPEEPLVVVPVEKIGEYGGTLRSCMLGRGDTAGLTRDIGYEGLVRWSADCTKVVPNIAKMWRVTDEGKTFTFYLRKGMKWSDGQPFTADDILFWYDDVLLNKELTPTIPKWLTANGQVVKVEKLDDYTIRFKFAEPQGLFLQRLAMADGLGIILPKHYLKQFHIKYASKEKLDALVKEKKLTDWFSLFHNMNDKWMNPELPVILAWKVITPLGVGTRVTFERNAYYWKIDTAGNQLPYIDRVSYEIIENVEVGLMKLLNGEYDLETRKIASLENYPVLAENKDKVGYRFFTQVPTHGNDLVFAFNLNHKDPVLRKIFNDKRFRIAMSLALNRKDFIDLIYLGKSVPRQPSPLPGTPLYNEKLEKQYIEYDPVRANKLLDEIGLKRGSDGWRLRPDGKTLTITIEVDAGKKNREDAAALAKKFWDAVGIKTAVKAMDRTLFYTRKAAAEHDVNIWTGPGGIDTLLDPRWYFPFSSESNFAPLWALWYTSGGKSGEEPPSDVKRQMQLYNEILKTSSEKKQIFLMKQLLDISVKNFYVIGICSAPKEFGVARNNLRNIPEETVTSWTYVTPGPVNTCQFFFEK